MTEVVALLLQARPFDPPLWAEAGEEDEESETQEAQ